MGKFDPIRHILADVEQNPQWQGRQQFRRICDHWPVIVGDAVARHTRPVSLHNQQLRVATSSNTWSQNLMFERQRLLKKLNQYFQNPPLTPPVDQLHFSHGRWSQIPAPILKKRSPHPPPSKATTPNPKDIPSSRPPAPTFTTPHDAFNAWSRKVQDQRSQFPPCPLCQIPTPPSELERWSCCAPCANRQWHTLKS